MTFRSTYVESAQSSTYNWENGPKGSKGERRRDNRGISDQKRSYALNLGNGQIPFGLGIGTLVYVIYPTVMCFDFEVRT